MNCLGIHLRQVNKNILFNKNSKHIDFKVQDVIKAILDATKEEENLRVEFVKNSSLALSKDVFIDGMASNIKKTHDKLFKRFCCC